jgi:hypothetical protein
MKRTAKEWQALLNLEQEPDDELLELFENKLQLLRADIQEGIDQIENGDYDELDTAHFDNFFDAVKQRGQEKLKNKS